MTPSDELVAAVHIDADPDVVFAYFTDPVLVSRWLATSALLDPRPGGEFHIEIDEAVAHGSYVSVEPYSSIVFTWGIPGDESLPPGSTTVEVRLEPNDNGTLVTLTHRGLTGEARVSHEQGWRTFLANLAGEAGRSSRTT